VRQAAAFAAGVRVLPGGWAADAAVETLSPYAPGTALLQAPFVKAGGWRAAAWASVLALAVATIVLGWWLRDARYAPGFALLLPAYAPTMVVGRLALSDAPSVAAVTVGLWLFWTRGASGTRTLLAGVVAGLSTQFRETNLLVFMPFLVGAALRREPGWLLLAAGAAAGAAARPVASYLLFGSPLYVRAVEAWSLAAAADSIPFYAFALLVLIPGGLVAIAAYRGPRRPEMIAAVLLVMATYVFYDYSGQSSAMIARLAAAGRYALPLVPLFALAWAEVGPRWRRGAPLRALAVPAGAALVLAAFAVHPVLAWWSAPDAAIVRDIYATTAARSALVADHHHQRKYISPLYGERFHFAIDGTPPEALARVADRHQDVYIVAVSRLESPIFRGIAALGDEYAASARHHCVLDPVLDRMYGSMRRLRIWAVRTCRT
jgi:hypothetical protein